MRFAMTYKLHKAAIIFIVVGCVCDCALSAQPAGNVVSPEGSTQMHQNCATQDSVPGLIDELKLSIKSNEPRRFACLFQLATVNVEFNGIVWQGEYEQVSAEYQELIDSGFRDFIENSSDADIAVDATDQQIIFKKRLVVGYHKYGSNQLAISEIRDQMEPNEFLYSGIHSETEFRMWFADLQAAVSTDQKEALANMICYPLKADFFSSDYKDHYLTISSSKQFVDNYSKLFTPKMKSIVMTAVWPKLWHNSEGIMLGQGDIWIKPKGPTECISSISQGPGREE